MAKLSERICHLVILGIKIRKLDKIRMGSAKRYSMI